jgi:hypothetical protein
MCLSLDVKCLFDMKQSACAFLLLPLGLEENMNYHPLARRCDPAHPQSETKRSPRSHELNSEMTALSQVKTYPKKGRLENILDIMPLEKKLFRKKIAFF